MNRVNSGKAKVRRKWGYTFPRKGTGDLSGTFMSYLRHKAKMRGLEWNVSSEYLWKLFLDQNKQCALSGVPLIMESGFDSNGNTPRKYHTASLDRIDNKKPYIEGNLQWTHKIVNQMRRQYSVEEYIHWCSLVSNHANPERSAENVKQDVSANVQRLGGEETTNNPPTSARQPKCNCDRDSNGTLKCPIHG